MKIKATLLTTFGLLLFLTGLQTQAQEHQHGDGAGHTHYREHDDFLAHKLLFPSKVPDRVITNLTEDPATSFAVNWRTNQQIQTAFVEVAVATDGPGFLLDGVRRIKADTELFENHCVLSLGKGHATRRGATYPYE